MVKGQRPPGMMAVARHAGVSHQTVSRVLNDPDTVRPETRERVLASMRELGYSRNLAARALVTQHTSLLGVVWTGTNYFGPSSTVVAIELAARSAGYSCLVGALGEYDTEEMRALFQTFRDRGVEGIVAVAPHERAAALVAEFAAGIPTVLVSGVGPRPDFTCVAVDQELGARLVVGHMVERGCRRITHISGPSDWFDAQERVRGWRVALQEAGLADSPVLVGDWSPESGYHLGRALIESGDLPDAVFCGNDAMAMGLLRALREAGIEAPADLSVAGFDDIVGAAFIVPPLTTVAQPFAEIGRVALESLVRVMDGAAPTMVRLRPELIIRSSVR